MARGDNPKAFTPFRQIMSTVDYRERGQDRFDRLDEAQRLGGWFETSELAVQFRRRYQGQDGYED